MAIAAVKNQDTEQQPKRQIMPVPVGVTGVLRPNNLTEAIEVAKLMAHSGMVPKSFEGNPGAILVAIQMGAELGLSPMSAIQNIAVINGRPTIWGDAMLALVVSHPECEDVSEDFDETGKTAVCTVKRRNRVAITRTFSVEDAKIAGLWGKSGPWTQYPRRMLQMRARGFALRDSFPDALRGIVSAEEAGDFVHIPEKPLLVTESFSAPTPPVEVEKKTSRIAAKARANLSQKPEETPAEKPETRPLTDAEKAWQASKQVEKTAEQVMDERVAEEMEPGADG